MAEQATRQRLTGYTVQREDEDVDAATFEACQDHLQAAEAMLEQAGDLSSLARLALVIDMLRRGQGLPDRALTQAMLDTL